MTTLRTQNHRATLGAVLRAMITWALVLAVALGLAAAHAANYTVNDRWMANLAGSIGQRPLNQIVIPGAHDAGTYTMSAYHWAQELEVYDQLRHGVRWLDVRAYYEENKKDYMIFHGNIKPWWSDVPLTKVLDDIVRFMQEPGHEREIVIVTFEGKGAGYENLERANEICGELLFKAGPLLVRNSMLPPNTHIFKMTPDELLRLPGSPRLILNGLNRIAQSGLCGDIEMNPANYWFGNYYANQCTQPSVTAAIREALKGRYLDGGDNSGTNPQKLGAYVRGFYSLSVAATAASYCGYPMDWLFSEQAGTLDAVKGWYDKNEYNARKNLNILYGDFVDSSKLVEYAIAMNREGPVIEVTRSANDAEGSWSRQDVTLSFTCRSTAGLASSNVPASSIVSGTTATLGDPILASAELVHVLAPVTCTDVHGREARVAPTVRIDKSPPTITVSSPVDGASIAQNARVVVAYSCTDSVSHVALCQSPAGDIQTCSALDTRTPGTKSFRITAQDAAGNQTSKTVNYTVVPSAAAPVTGPIPVKWALSPTASGVGRLMCQPDGSNEWYEEGGDAAQLAVGPDGQPWAVVPDGRLTRRTAQGWKLAGDMRVRQVAVGANGVVWAITNKIAAPKSMDYSIATFNPATNAWSNPGGEAIRIAVGPDGKPWVVTSAGKLWSWNATSGFAQVSANVRDMTVASDGVVWMFYGGPSADKGWPITTYNPKTGKWAPVLLGLGSTTTYVERLGPAADGSIWVSARDGTQARIYLIDSYGRRSKIGSPPGYSFTQFGLLSQLSMDL